MFFLNILIGIVILIFNLEKAEGQCTTTETIGVGDTKSKKNSNYDGTGVVAILTQSNKFQFKCCGFITSWEVYVRNGVATPVDVTIQVWEDTGTTWNLRGQNVITVTNDNAENIVDVSTPVGNRIRAKANDQIGFYEHAGSVITYGNGGGGESVHTSTAYGGETTYNWDSITTATNREHAIHGKIGPSLAPSFTNLDDTSVIQNTLVGGSVVFTLTTSDPDQEDTNELAVAPTAFTGSAATFFELDTVTLQVKVRASVTLTPGSHSITYTVTDPCGLSATGVLTVRVENQAPVIDSLVVSNSISISEDKTLRELLHTLLVTDTDPITCTLITTGVPFEITKISGSTNYGIYLKANPSMDYDTRNAYVLSLSCTDTYDTTLGTYTVNLIRNEPPSIIGLPLAIDITEDTTVETTVYTISTTDPTNDLVICVITSTVPASTTILFLKPSANPNEYDIIIQSSPNLQYDVQRTYRLNIECTDGRRSDSGIFFVNIKRNQPPVLVNLQNITTVSSISAFIGQIVFDVEHTDLENDQVQYSMSCVPSTNCPFQIYHSGEILLERQIVGEFIPVYDIYVYVTDGKSTTGPRSLTVHILDINYIPVIRNLPLPSALVISENSNPSLSIFQVSIQDNDGGDTHAYTMISNPGDGMSYFDIDAATGEVSTSATNNINYEAVTSSLFVFTLTVTDTKDSSAKNLSVTIADVNEAPIFTKTSYVLSVDEGSAGTVLTDPGYLYTDEDPGDTHKFTMTCGLNVGYFSIAPNTGRISLATDIDVDAAGLATSYTCAVTISDGSLTDTASLVINVNNINDNTPSFATNFFTYYVGINTAVNTVIGSAVATDRDTGSFGTFTYSLDQTGLGADTFGIQANGDIYLKSSLTSYGYGQSLTFTVQATDTGGLVGTATVYVLIPQTTTTTTTTTNRYVTFWEYPANTAWVIVAIGLGLVITVLPCIMIWRNQGSCTYKGRPKPLSEDKRQFAENRNYRSQHDEPRNDRDFNLHWKPWKWFQVQQR